MGLHVAKIRADAAAKPGDVVVLTKAQLYALLDEVEDGQAAKCQLRHQDSADGLLGIDGVSQAN